MEIYYPGKYSVRLQLFALAYNFGNFLRRLALSKSINDWALKTMREKLVY